MLRFFFLILNDLLIHQTMYGHKSVSFTLKGVPQFTRNTLLLGCLEKFSPDFKYGSCRY